MKLHRQNARIEIETKKSQTIFDCMMNERWRSLFWFHFPRATKEKTLQVTKKAAQNTQTIHNSSILCDDLNRDTFKLFTTSRELSCLFSSLLYTLHLCELFLERFVFQLFSFYIKQILLFFHLFVYSRVTNTYPSDC